MVVARAFALSGDSCDFLCASAAVDTRHTGRHANAFDGEERKKEDYDNLVNTALRKAGSKKALLPTRSKKHFKEIDLRDLTLSKRKFVVEQALEVIHCSCSSSWLQACTYTDCLSPIAVNRKLILNILH